MKMENISKKLKNFFLGIVCAFPAALFLATNKYIFYKDSSGYLEYLGSREYFISAAALTLILALFYLFRGGKKLPGKNFIRGVMAVNIIELALVLFKYNIFILTAIFNIAAAAGIFIYIAGGAFELKIPGGRGKRALYFIFAAVFIIIFSRTALNHYSFSTNAKDMGIFTNLVYNVSYYNTHEIWIDGFKDQRGVHFQPVIYIFAALFRITSSPYMLLFFQALLLCGGIIFIYRLALFKLTAAETAFFTCAALAVSPYLARAVNFDFHFSVFYFTAFTGFIFFAVTSRFYAALAFFLGGIFIKEEIAIYMFFAAIFVFFENRDKRYLVLSALSVVYAAAVILFIIPHFNPEKVSFAWSFFRGIADFKRYLGPSALGQLLVYTAGAGFIFFLYPRALLLLFLPPALLHLLSFKPSMPLYGWYYSAIVTPALFVSLVYGLKKIKDKYGDAAALNAAFLVFLIQVQLHLAFMPAKNSIAAAGVYVLFAGMIIILPALKAKIKRSTVITAFTVYIVFAGYFSYYGFRQEIIKPEMQESVREALKIVPKDPQIPVIANSYIVPHVSSRRYADFIEKRGTDEIFRPLIRERISRFFMLSSFHFLSYGHGESSRIFDILREAKKKGYVYRVIYRKNGVILFEFFNRKFSKQNSN